MFNANTKKTAVANLRKVGEQYEKRAIETQKQALNLFEFRRSTSDESIASVEAYINTLAHTPKQYIKVVSEYRVEVQKFDDVIDEIIKEAAQVHIKSSSMAGAGIGAGAAFAAFAPTAALAIATTFGTASTGAAISALTGVAATNAALAWLGGGALAVGGGGVAAGEALLVLAGPVGWTIGGVTLLGTGLWMRGKNARIATEATEHAAKIEGKNNALAIAQREIAELAGATKTHAAGLENQLSWLIANAPTDFTAFGNDEKYHLAALINNVECLSSLLNKKVA